jgi:predicted kinase
MKRNFHMMVGIVGSGKSTHVKKLQEKTGSTIVCPDDIRFELTGDVTDQSKNHYIFYQVVPERIKTALETGDVIYDATNFNRKNRSEILILAKTLGCHIIVHQMLTTFEECIRRNAARSERVVPDCVLERMMSDWESPDVVIEKIDEIHYVG